MKRTMMFLLLGPSLVALAVWMVAVAIAGRIDDAFVGICAIAAFLLTLPVSAIAGLVDGYLARALPALLRASLTAAFGTAMAIGLVLALFTMMFSTPVPPEVMNGALCAGFFLLLPMGVCSLLSNDIGRQRHSIEPALRVKKRCADRVTCDARRQRARTAGVSSIRRSLRIGRNARCKPRVARFDFVMGACSLSSHDYSGRLRPSIEPVSTDEKAAGSDPVDRHPRCPVINYLTSPLNVSFTLSQPKGDRLIAS